MSVIVWTCLILPCLCTMCIAEGPHGSATVRPRDPWVAERSNFLALSRLRGCRDGRLDAGCEGPALGFDALVSSGLASFALMAPSYDHKVNLSIANMSAMLTSVSYCSNPSDILHWNCTRCASIPGFQPYKIIVDAVWDLQAFVGYMPDWHDVVIAFRGTDSHNLWNWVENMRAWRVDAAYPVTEDAVPKLHSGFLLLWNSSSIGPLVTEAVGALRQRYPSAGLHISGHSMGGALAQLAALDMKFKYGFERISVYTFGSPRVGDTNFASLFQRHVNASWRFTHNRDIVPSMPPWWLGFHHVAREVWLLDLPGPSKGSDQQQEVVVCDGSGEDPLCHDGACLLGLCTSLADHLMYLNAPMYHKDEEC